MKVRFLELTKVYNKENVKSSPIFELQAGTEARMVKEVMKAWKLWNEILLPDGRKGVVPAVTRMLRFGL
jgi:hypothetical protein